MIAEVYYAEFSRQFRLWKKKRSRSYVTDDKGENGRKGRERNKNDYFKTASNDMFKRLLQVLVGGAVLVTLASCSSKTYKNINYLQDVRVDTTLAMKINKGIQIQPQDKISIVVSARTPELAAMFNLNSVNYRAGSETTNVGGGGGGNLLGYVVDNNGEINFPVLGNIYVAGMTRWELADYVKRELADRDLLRDAVVTVEFMNFKFSVIGEVKSPGTYNVIGDKINVLQALSMAGDLTIYGVRQNVSVIREAGRKRTVYLLDLTSSDIFESPAYYLQQSDVIYVEPSKVRAGQSKINENNFRSVGFWTSIPSFLMSTTTAVLVLMDRLQRTNNSNKTE